MLEKAAAAKKISVEEAKQQFLRQAGLCRFGEPEEIADLIAFVVSPAARWMTGTVLRMDGGEVKSV
jgi:3-oxoacyl-[acyl-carrier protein] reductase